MEKSEMKPFSERRDEAALKFNWSGIVNRLRTAKTAFKLGADFGYAEGKKDAEAERKDVDQKHVELSREILANAETLARAFDALKQENEELKYTIKTWDDKAAVATRVVDLTQKLSEAQRERDNYAQAMALALKEGIFANKEYVKKEIEKLIKDCCRVM